MTFRVKIYSEKANRQQVAAAEISTLVYRSLTKTALVSKVFWPKMWSRKKKACENRLKNRCVHSNRGKSVLRFFRCSRIVFRLKAREGRFLGVRRSIW